MQNAKEYYELYISDISTLPISFDYGEEHIQGLGRFTVISQQTVTTDLCLRTEITAEYKDLRALAIIHLFPQHNAIDHTLYLTNTGSDNSAVIANLHSFRDTIRGEYSLLRGIEGDHENKYAPYVNDLSQGSVAIFNTEGRATHIHFPYFDVASSGGGMRLAIGWSGTWRADFNYTDKGITTITADNVPDLRTYLKPGESIRTARICRLFYEGDEDAGVNQWRFFMRECVLPKVDGQPLEPFTTVCLASDTGRPNSDGSVSEYDGSYRRSLDAIFENGITPNYRWVDAGWYFDPYGRSIAREWTMTGSWQLDTQKWKNDSFADSVRYARQHNTRTLVWFEPESVTGIHGLQKNYGYNRSWALNGSCWALFANRRTRRLSNLGNPDCYEWTKGRILDFLQKYDVDMYREDMNLAPTPFWRTADCREGKNREGITENKYIVAHYRLWDEIIEYCRTHAKTPFVDSCASGGGRNDYESAFRSVPLLRSDSDRTTIALRLAYTSTLSKWLIFGGCCVKEATHELDDGVVDDIYVLRSSYLPAFNFSHRWSLDRDKINYPLLRTAISEWDRVKEFFYDHFYLLTPYARYDDDTHWTVFEYIKPNEQRGVILAFRQNKCVTDSVTVNFHGIESDSEYCIKSIDGYENTLSGKELHSFVICADSPRSSQIFFFEKI